MFCFQHKKGIKNFYFIALGQGNPTTSIDSAAANRIDSASVITLTKQSAGSEKSFVTSLVAESKNGDMSEIVGECVFKTFGYFGEVRPDFNSEKVNFLENSRL